MRNTTAMSEVCVRVALRIRPLLPKEVLHNHQVCVRVVPGSAQVMLGSDRSFLFDHAFGPTANQDEVYGSCVQPLVESLVNGYNATVFCYGQTGTGKTYTLGGGNLQDEEGGIINRVARDVFMLLQEKKQNGNGGEATVRVSYMELYREELRDLLELPTVQNELHIREDQRGNTVVIGAKEMVVTSAQELLSALDLGNGLRHTATTGMNEHSSRSHTILTLQLIQCCNSSLKSASCSKFCLVDLAGSERVAKTGNTGLRLKESTNINSDLLALGNVIRALTDPNRDRRGNNAYIPYRDAKITRLLRDSLGGTAHTLMVACVSPSHHSVVETLSVLHFASKARYIHNCPEAVSAHTEFKSCPTTWDPRDARLDELEHEVQTLRKILKDKTREMEREKKGGGAGDGDSLKQPSQIMMTDNQEEPPQYCLLAQEAAALLADVPNLASSPSFSQRLQDWQERLTAVNHSHPADDEKDQPHHVTMLKLKEELNECKEALRTEEQLLEQKYAELRQLQTEVEKLLQERKTHLQAFEEEKERNRIQIEQLTEQQILIKRLRSDLVTFRGATSRACGNSGTRPGGVPVIIHNDGHESPKKIADSLEKVIAAFKVRSDLLQAEIDVKDKVYCPFIKQQAAESKDGDQEKKNIPVGRKGDSHFLNKTWTESVMKEESAGGPVQMPDANPSVQQPQRATGTKENLCKQSHVRKLRLSASVTERRIQDLSVNMSMKEELIKQLDLTDKETQAVGRHDGEDGVLARLSMQSQQVRAEVSRSLQHMIVQRAQLQSSLRQQRENNNNNEELDQNGEQSKGDLTVCKSNHQEELKETQRDCVWLEEEEEHMFQTRAEQSRRKEVILRREACLQQKNKLEIKRLRSSQALSQDLLRVSVRLDSVEEQLQSSRDVRLTGGVTMEKMAKERDALRKRRDTLESQLKDNRVLTVEDEHTLLQLEEAVKCLDTALEFKNSSIQDKQEKLLISNSSTLHSQSTEPAQHCDVIRKLKRLSPSEALDLLAKYFNKVVCLREAEHHLRLHCEELERHSGEQEAELREMEVAMQRLTLDADRRLTQQHQDHQRHIQMLLQNFKKGCSGEAQQAIEDRLQHVEKELYFYKSSSRQLKKKLKDLCSEPSINQPTHTQEHRQTHNVQVHTSANEPQTHTEEVETTHIATASTKIDTEQTDKKRVDQTPCPSSSSDLQACKTTKMPEYNQTHTQSQGRKGESLGMTPARVRRRELREISPATTTRRQTVVDTSTESMLEDSIEVP